MDAAREVLAPLSPVSRAVGEQDRAEVLTAAGRARDAVAALETAAAAYGERRLRTSRRSASWPWPAPCCGRTPRGPAPSPGGPRGATAARTAPCPRCARTPSPSLAEIGVGNRALAGCAAPTPSPSSSAARAAPRATLRELQTAQARAAPGRRVDTPPPGSTGSCVDEDSPVETRLLLARGARRAGPPVGAAESAWPKSAGLAELHAWQSSFGSLDLQSALVGHGRALACRACGWPSRTARPEIAVEYGRSGRALVGRVAPVRPPADDGWPPT